MDNNFIWSYFFPMKKGIFDDDYYFYEDGRILHSYDRTQQKLNIEEYVTADSISIEKRMEMLESCPPDKYNIVKSILKI